jgi:hypothetical protein
MMNRGKFRAWLKGSTLIGLLLSAMLGCVLIQSAWSQVSDLPLWADSSTIWTSRNIPVCWENPTNNFTNETNWVRSSVTNSWQNVSLTNFQGWGTCNSGSGGIRIRINDEGPHVKRLGSGLNGFPDGMVLNFTFNNWDQSCRADRERCIRVITRCAT